MVRAKQHQGDPRDRLKTNRPECCSDGKSDLLVPLARNAAVAGDQDTADESVLIPNFPVLADFHMVEARSVPFPRPALRLLHENTPPRTRVPTLSLPFSRQACDRT